MGLSLVLTAQCKNFALQNVAFKSEVRHRSCVDKPQAREKQKGINLWVYEKFALLLY